MFEECRLEGDFTLSSGRMSSFFYDFDLLLPREAADYVEQLIREVPEGIWKDIDFIASPALGGIVPGFLTAFAKQKPLVIIDKEGKARGPAFKTGGYLIVDDVITSFGAANAVVDALGHGNVVCGAAAYIFRGNELDIMRQNYPTFYLARKEQEI